jgi:hypothetical protein
MQKEIIDFFQTQFISVFALEMMDGSPHASTMHFAFSENPMMFLFETYKPYRKYEALAGREISRASLVIGFDENNRRTLQVDGEAHIIKSDSERILFNKIYFKKFPNKKEKADQDKFVSFIFIPKWWRYTDWDSPKGKTVLSS